MKSFMKCIPFLLAFAIPSFTWAEIRVIHSVEEIKDEISQEDLVFIDLGYTLQYPAEPMIARYEARPFVLDQTAELEEPTFKQISTLLLAHIKWALVEESMKGFIDSLQSRGIATLGITGGGRIPYIGQLPYEPQLLPSTEKRIEPVEAYYVEALRSSDIDFSMGAPQSDLLDKSMTESRCIYRDGVLFLCHQSMGDIIPIFYRDAPQKYAKVVAIDDEIFYLRHLEQKLAEENIPFEGFYYVRYADLEKDYDQSLAAFELQHLIDHKEVLSDEKARSLQEEQNK